MEQQDTIKTILEREVSSERFRMSAIFEEIMNAVQGTRVLHQCEAIMPTLGEKVSDYVLRGIIRFAFLIELVKTPKIETTKFEVRWADRLAQADPRYSTYEGCLEIFESALATLEEKVRDPDWCELLRLFESWHLLPYEIPLDYKERKGKAPMHQLDNVAWTEVDPVKRAVTLRSFLFDKGRNPYTSLFALAYDKIKVKTYLTDRVLTGPHKTNREKRWETHPASVHFALRRACLATEVALIHQLCHFQDFPSELRQALRDTGLLTFRDELFRCPVTMEPLSFAEFEREVRDPIHGKAAFQVGHLNPLKSLNDSEQSGHNAENISWVSSEGNRIQGSLSLRETRALIERIHANYRKFGIV